jgi:hypothetical protein
MLYYDSTRIRISSKNTTEFELFKFVLIDSPTHEEWEYIMTFFSNIFNLNSKKYVFNFVLKIEHMKLVAQYSYIIQFIRILQTLRPISRERLIKTVFWIRKDPLVHKFLSWLLYIATPISLIEIKELILTE